MDNTKKWEMDEKWINELNIENNNGNYHKNGNNGKIIIGNE